MSEKRFKNYLKKCLTKNDRHDNLLKLSQVSDNKPLQNEAKQNKKVVDKYRWLW